jgi:hypothetical protein
VLPIALFRVFQKSTVFEKVAKHGKLVRKATFLKRQDHAPNSSSNAFASLRSAVSNPSVNQP